MLTFLRKIRRSLIGSGSTRKYLLYAIGEIALVVIGILIALQINNWNEWRKEREKEIVIINSLVDELSMNQDYLLRRKSLITNCINGGRQLLKSTGPHPVPMSSDTFSILMNSVLNINYLNPETSNLDRITSSEDFNLIRYDSLKFLLLKYAAIIYLMSAEDNTRQAAENSLRSPQNNFYNYQIIKLGADQRSWNEFKGLENSKFEINPTKILSDPTFEFQVGDILQGFHYSFSRINDVLARIRLIQKYIERHYNIE